MPLLFPQKILNGLQFTNRFDLVKRLLPGQMNRLQSAPMNEYQQALDYLYSFANFEHKRIEQYSPENISLERPESLLHLLGDPQLSCPAIHIAGTKGKGSVAAMCA
jgi:hypothetical protein